jgi:hypothetical protein
MSRFTHTIGLLVLGTQLSSFASGPFDQWQWRNPLPQGLASISAITYANGTFAAVGDEGTVSSSLDGTNWVSRPPLGPIYGPGTNYLAYAITWGNGVWVAVGSGGSTEVSEISSGVNFTVILIAGPHHLDNTAFSTRR